MYKGSVISIAIPAHNEEAHIARVIETMPSFVDHMIVVDDASTDATSEKAMAVGDSRVEVIRHEKNLGVGGAIITAHRRGLELGCDVSVVMAGDAQMDPDYLPSLLDPIVDRGYGFAKANRFFSMGSFRGMPRKRVLGNIVLSFLTKLASGYWRLFDPQNGYTAISRTALQRLDLDHLAKTYEFENDLLISLNILGIRALDVPIPAVYGDERSGIKMRRVIPDISRLLVRGFFRRLVLKYVLRSFSPVALFFFSGLALVAWGMAFGVWVIFQTIGPDAASTGTVILSVVPFVVGVQLLISAIVLDIQESPDR